MNYIDRDGVRFFCVEGGEFTDEDEALKYEGKLLYDRADKTSFHLDEYIRVDSPTEYYMLANYYGDFEPNFDPERVEYPTIICYTKDGLSECNVYIPSGEFFAHIYDLAMIKDAMIPEEE